MSNGTAQSAYDLLVTDRQPFLERARECAKLTIPSLLPEEKDTNNQSFTSPYQSFGSRAVNNLSNKLLITLFPPNAPYFRLQISDSDLKEFTGNENPDRGQAEEELASIERTIMAEQEARAMRPAQFEALKHAIVTGNGLLYFPKEEGNSVRFFSLDQYVVLRDPNGQVLKHITKEGVSPIALPEEIREQLSGENLNNDKFLDLYTHVERTGSGWTSYQEIKGIKFNQKEYSKHKSPWIPLRYNQIDGENYGRGLVEENYGDLKSLEALTKAIVQGSQAAAKVVFLVRPNGSTRQQVIQNAYNGDVVPGHADDITVLQLDKFADFRIAQDTASRVEERLAHAFLLHSSAARDAERVTAEEVRFMAQELESGLGGTYSLLSQEFQLPLVKLVMDDLIRKNKLPDLPDTVKPSIVTGVEALGRGQDLNRLMSFTKILVDTLGPEVIGQYVNVGDLIDRLGASHNIDTSGLIKDQEQLAMEQEQAAQEQDYAVGMDMAGKVAPTVAKELVNQQGS